MAAPLDLALDDTALVVVDMQNAFLEELGSLAMGGASVLRAQSAAPHAKRMLDIARAAGVPVVFTRMAFRKDGRDYGMFRTALPKLVAVDHCLDGTWDAELHPDFRPLDGEYVVDKNRFSAFHGTALDSILRGLGVHNLVVIGVATNVCVEGTIRDAFQLDYRCVVPCEATASYSEKEENAGFTTLSFAFAELVSVDDVAAALA